MKFIGFLFIISGMVVLSFIAFTLMNRPAENFTPIPDNEDVQIIYLSPTK